MWEFMSNYAESFWEAGDYAFEVFSVIMAWAITLGIAGIIAWMISIIPAAIKEWIDQEKKNQEYWERIFSENDKKEKH